MKLVYKNENRPIVYSIKNILGINDIDTHIKNEYEHTIGGGLGLSNTLMELWVLNDDDYLKARAIIEDEIETPTTLQPWKCAQCGEMNEGNFQVCWQCQSEHLDA